MIVAALVSPITVPYILGWISLVVVFLVAVASGALFGFGVVTGTPGAGDILVVTLTSTLVVGQLAILLGMCLYRGVEANFSRLPWLRHEKTLALKDSDEAFAARCPFTGLRPAVKCPSCGAHIHDLAMHEPPRPFWLSLGSEPLRWEHAEEALTSGLPLREARSRLDAALDFRGSFLSLACTPACRGCVTWRRALNLAPRLSLTLALAAVTLACTPWAVASTLRGFGDTGRALQALALLASVFYASAALLIQAQALARVESFLHLHEPTIPALVPLLPDAPLGSVARRLRDELCLARWH